MIKPKHQRPRRRKCQFFLLAHLNPSHVKTPRSIKKKVKPEKILLAVPFKMEAGCNEKRKKEEERREIRQKRKRNTRSAKS